MSELQRCVRLTHRAAAEMGKRVLAAGAPAMLSAALGANLASTSACVRLVATLRAIVELESDFAADGQQSGALGPTVDPLATEPVSQTL